MMTTVFDQVPPTDRYAEEAILGCILIESDKLRLIREIIQPSDFSDPYYRVIYETMCSLVDVEMPIDLLTLSDALRKTPAPPWVLGDPRQNFMQVISGRVLLPNLMEAPTTAAMADHYAKIVLEKSVLRTVIAQASQAAELAFAGDFKQLLAANGRFNLSAILASCSPTVCNPFEVGLMRACDLPPAQPPQRLWFGLYPRSVVLVIGETGAGKSSLLYNMVIHAARNEPLWNHDFGLGRPLRVLYVDPENSGNFMEGSGGQCAVKVERIAQGKPRDLYFHGGANVNLADVAYLSALESFIMRREIDIVVLDPIANLFRTKDENDNAEAARQMTALTTLSRTTGACIVPVHHSGKDNTSNYGRGASARLAAADVGLMLRARGHDEDEDDTYTGGDLKQREDICRLQIVKNRLEGRGSLYLRMRGQDRFDLASFQEWKSARSSAPHTSKVEQAEEEIQHFLADGAWCVRAEIVRAMQAEGIGETNVDRALQSLLEQRILTKRTLDVKGKPVQYVLSSMVPKA